MPPETLYFPLRSSAAWFETEDKFNELDRRLKACSVLYERLCFENGRIITAGGMTGCFELRPPVEAIDRGEIEFFRPGSNFGLAVGKTPDNVQPIFGGQAEYSFEIDFYPIWARAGLGTPSWISWFDMPDLERNAAEWVARAVQSDRDDPAAKAFLPSNFFLQGAMLKGFYSDSLVLSHLGPISVSDTVGRLATWKTRQQAQRLVPDLRRDALAAGIEFGIPDFASMSWEEVARIRESTAAQDLREMIRRVAEDVASTLPEFPNQYEVAASIGKRMLKEAVQELRARRSKPVKVFFDLLLNLVPYSWVVSSGMNLSDVAREQRSWVSFLR